MSAFEQEPICVDDFGDAVYIGHWSGRLVWPDSGRWYGAIIPQCNSRYVDDRQAEKKERQFSYRLFADSDANCNTCKHLERVVHARTWTGFLQGKCRNPSSRLDLHPYLSRFKEYSGNMLLHPDDFMGMPCYESRWINEP